jgi:hypothetical protein
MPYNVDKLRKLIDIRDALRRELHDLDEKLSDARADYQRVENNLRLHEDEPPQHLVDESERRFKLLNRFKLQREEVYSRWSSQANLVSNCQKFLEEKGFSPDPDFSAGTAVSI